MATPAELQHLCLFLAAGGMAYGKRGSRLPASVRCALYMLVAFSLRRGNLGRDLLRGNSTQSRPRSSISVRSLIESPAFHSLSVRVAGFLFPPQDKARPLAICCR